jgi:hypothetical protein
MMDLQERIDAVLDLADLSVWHDGKQWTCIAKTCGGLTELASGNTPAAAMLTALTILDRFRPDTAERLPSPERAHH